MEVEWRLVKKYAQMAKRYFGDNLLAFAVFGSLARGEAKFPESDIDLLIVLKNVTGTVGKRIEMLSEVEKELEKTEEYRDFLNKYRWKPVFQEHMLSERELKLHPPLLLDLVHDAVIIYDTGVLERELRIVEEKLKKLGAKRVEKGKDRFWILKPDIKLHSNSQINKFYSDNNDKIMANNAKKAVEAYYPIEFKKPLRR